MSDFTEESKSLHLALFKNPEATEALTKLTEQRNRLDEIQVSNEIEGLDSHSPKAKSLRADLNEFWLNRWNLLEAYAHSFRLLGGINNPSAADASLGFALSYVEDSHRGANEVLEAYGVSH